MEFFKQLTEHLQPGVTLNLTVVVKDGQLTVGVLPSAKEVKIPMLMINGTPEEVDESFFSTISAPIQRATGLITNTEDFNKQVDEEEKEITEEKTQSSKKVVKAVVKKKAPGKEKDAKKEEVPAAEGPKEQSLF